MTETNRIKVIPTSHQEVMALLNSEALRLVEDAIAERVRMKVVREYSTARTTYTQAEMSVSGMTVQQIEQLLSEKKNALIEFGVRFLRDEEATKNEQEYPEGEEADEPDVIVEVRGLGIGFGIKYAIFFNFLAHRTPAEFREFLKNRRIPKHTKFMKELARVYEEATQAHH